MGVEEPVSYSVNRPPTVGSSSLRSHPINDAVFRTDHNVIVGQYADSVLLTVTLHVSVRIDSANLDFAK